MFQQQEAAIVPLQLAFDAEAHLETQGHLRRGLLWQAVWRAGWVVSSPTAGEFRCVRVVVVDRVWSGFRGSRRACWRLLWLAVHNGG